MVQILVELARVSGGEHASLPRNQGLLEQTWAAQAALLFGSGIRQHSQFRQHPRRVTDTLSYLAHIQLLPSPEIGGPSRSAFEKMIRPV